MTKSSWIVSIVLVMCSTVLAAAPNSYQRPNSYSARQYTRPAWQQSVHVEENRPGITGGNFMLSAVGGASFPVSSDMKCMVKTGSLYGIQAMISATDSFALGLEFTSMQYNKGKEQYSQYGLSWETDKFELTQRDIMLAMRMYANPQNRVRFYNSLGLGISFVKIKDDWTYSGGYHLPSVGGTDKESFRSFAFYGGLGLEAEIVKNLVLGVEGRVNYTRMKRYDLDTIAISALARVGYKF